MYNCKNLKGSKNAVLLLKSLFTSYLAWWAQRDLNPRPRDYESPLATVLCGFQRHSGVSVAF